jgi:hypothetical protein
MGSEFLHLEAQARVSRHNSRLDDQHNEAWNRFIDEVGRLVRSYSDEFYSGITVSAELQPIHGYGRCESRLATRIDGGPTNIVRCSDEAGHDDMHVHRMNGVDVWVWENKLGLDVGPRWNEYVAQRRAETARRFGLDVDSAA